jgi:hypothetical protein
MNWEEESETPFSPSDVCPFSNEEIEEYLRGCHYHYVLIEAPTKFAVSRFLDQRGELGRRFWLIEAQDEWGRAWPVIVGSGVSCFRADRYMRRWMYGLEPDGSLDSRQIFDAEMANQLERDKDWVSHEATEAEAFRDASHRTH